MTRIATSLDHTSLEKEEIPTLLFGGRSHLPFATAFVIAFSDDPRDSKQWLQMAAPEITYGHDRCNSAVALALSRTGLRRLGMAEEDLESFPTAFQSGMTSPGRPRALGDTGCSDPAKWLWGGSHQTCDALLIQYAESATILEQRETIQTRRLKSFGGTIVYRVGLQKIGPNGINEPFGFRDGVSQPVLRGTPRADAAQHAGHDIAAGEFILGYNTMSGPSKISPLVAAIRDPKGILPPAHTTTSPFSRDFGRNGTFLVVRQLEQDVDAFNDCVVRAATALTEQGILPKHLSPNEQQELVAAKMMGRWRNGSSLVRHPAAPGRSIDNDFLYANEDPFGRACPLGAHIRRANPRDSLDPDVDDAAAITSRHRLMRVGRAYTPPRDGERPGILFMCLNADIEMQFEVVQQSWLMRKTFHGLRDETDPFVGHSEGKRRYTVPGADGPGQLTDLRNFVTVKGGAYFFMPSRSAIRFLVQS